MAEQVARQKTDAHLAQMAWLVQGDGEMNLFAEPRLRLSVLPLRSCISPCHRS